jgi:hypothetical protein
MTSMTTPSANRHDHSMTRATRARTSPAPKNKKNTRDICPKTHLFSFCCARKVPFAHRRLVL